MRFIKSAFVSTIFLHFLFFISFFLGSYFLSAQSLGVKDWAKRIGGNAHPSNSSGNALIDMVTDKHGNIYTLSSISPFQLYIDGQTITNDSTAKTVLVSWDCNGTFRWMKIIGGSNIAAINPTKIVADTAEGIYISGDIYNQQANDSSYFDTDTIIKGTAEGLFITKYNSSGVMQWFKTPVFTTLPTGNSGRLINLTVTENGDLYWYVYLKQGNYENGAVILSSNKYCVLQYNAAGVFQQHIVLDMMTTYDPFDEIYIKRENKTGRYYISGKYFSNTLGTLTIGNTTIQSTLQFDPVLFVAAFNTAGSSLWVKQGSANKTGAALAPIFDEDGNIFIAGNVQKNTVFNGDTIVNHIGYNASNLSFLTLLDTMGNKLWLNVPRANINTSIKDMVFSNGNLMITGNHDDTLMWDSTILYPAYFGQDIYMCKLNAATGKALAVDSLTNTKGAYLPKLDVDKNGNVYLTGFFNYFLQFGTTTLLKPDTSLGYVNWFVAKYKNVNCNCNLLQPAFSYTQQAATTYQFTYNGTTPYTAIQWDFGDGAVTTANPSPTHTFAATKNYPVCVTVTNGCGENTACHWVNILPTDVQNLPTAGNILIYPNPTSNEIILEKTTKGSCAVLYNLQGQKMQQTILNSDKNRMNISSLPQGVYLLRITAPNGAQISRRILKE
jgi:hypothetical protein